MKASARTRVSGLSCASPILAAGQSSPSSPTESRIANELTPLATLHRYIYDLYYKREAISKELYDWLLKQEYADAK